MEPRLFTLQFGGAVGTLASLGSDGLRVQETLAGRLDLAMPDMPWHSARDRFAELAGECALIAGTLAKIAGDVALLMQSEIGELSEPAEKGRGGSSTMPQKRNPVAAIAILAACEKIEALFPLMNRSMASDHERGTGRWHAEWLALPEIVVLTASALAAMRELMGGIEVDTVRMRENLDLTGGLIMSEAVMMALAPTLGRLAAHDLVAHAGARAAAEGRHLKEVLADDTRAREALSTEGIEDLFDPVTYTGQAGAFVDRVLAEAAAQELGVAGRKGGDD
jgi:3-carboxy-cis,cis-muconate cycloisomerase